ncbi:MAG: hypothetical protein Q4G69_13305 [Planctomycetia bacterium]|nr:hypothetical protein [Planctomycetia bacterium]
MNACKRRDLRNGKSSLWLQAKRGIQAVALGLVSLGIAQSPDVFGQSNYTQGTSIRITSPVESPWTNPSGEVAEIPFEGNGQATLSQNGARPIRTSELNTSRPEMARPAVRLTQSILPQGNAPRAPKADPFLAPESIIAPERDAAGNIIQKNGGMITLPDGTRVNVNSKDENPLAPQNKNVPRNLSTESGQAPQKGTTAQQDGSRPKNPPKDLGRRRDDGSMTNNPYGAHLVPGVNNACPAADYYPGYFPNQANEGMCERNTPPAAAYGYEMYGHPWCFSNICPSLYYAVQNTQVGVGVLGYRNPMDTMNQGNFGADLSLNWSTPTEILCGISGQAGGRYAVTSLNGYDTATEKSSNRNQLFWTAGIFYRNPCSCWQWGVVYDSLNDDSFSDYTIGQYRTEVSRKIDCNTDIGFRGAFRASDEVFNFWRFDSQAADRVTVQATSWYAGFIRKYFECGGQGDILVGATENSDLLVGANVEVPISDYIALKNSFTYVFANDRHYRTDFMQQTWNVSISLTVFLGGNSRESLQNPLRPLLDVADNGSFLQSYKH